MGTGYFSVSAKSCLSPSNPLSHHEAREGHEGSDIYISRLFNFVIFVSSVENYSSLAALLRLSAGLKPALASFQEFQ
jgi:hypothetical protein